MRKNTKRILLVSHEMTYTGAPRSLLYMAEVLRKESFYVEVWSIKDGPFLKEYKKKRIHAEIIDRNIEEQRNRIASFDLIILNTIYTVHFVDYFNAITRTILFIREGMCLPQMLSNMSVSESQLRRINEIYVVSEYAKSVLEDIYQLSEVKVLHNYVKNAHWLVPNFAKKNEINFMVSGTVEKRKGLDIAIEAFNLMPDNLKNCAYLHVVGNIPEWADDYWSSLSLKWNNRIIYHGYINNDKELYSLYKKMNVFLIPSRDEPCSLVALEGAMLGKALIMSENVGAKYLDEKKYGVYPTYDVETLCRKMCSYTSRKTLLIQGLKMRYKYLITSSEFAYRRRIKELFTMV